MGRKEEYKLQNEQFLEQFLEQAAQAEEGICFLLFLCTDGAGVHFAGSAAASAEVAVITA